MSIKNDRIQARISPDLKEAAESIFSQIGISSGEAIRMFYAQVKLHGGLPFDVRVPNAATLDAMEELETGGGQRFDSAQALFDSWKDDE